MKDMTLAGMVLLASISHQLTAQNLLGPWDGSTTFYVSTTGVNQPPPIGGTFANPMRSISFALASAAQISPASPVTINVFPGTYDMLVENFPLVVPAEGVALEALSDGVIITAQGTNQNVIEVRGTRSGALPEAVIQNFTITNGLNGVVLDESLSGLAVPGWRQETRVRFCQIVSNDNAGILIRTAADEDGIAFRSEHLIERNEISENSIGVAVTSDGGYDATMIRCNRIFDNDFNVALNVIVGPTIDDPLDRLFARLCSNFIFDGNIASVQVSGGTTFLINNTIADSVLGLDVGSNSTVDVASTIFWNPAGMDLQMSTVGVAAQFRHCDFQNPAALTLANGFPNSQFNVSQDPLFVGVFDYHLTADSPLIDQGDHMRVEPAAAGEAIVAQDPTWVVPLAPGLDIDWEPRILRMQGRTSPNLVPVEDNRENDTWYVDIGADEVNHVNFLAAPPPGNFTETSLIVTSSLPQTLDRAGTVRGSASPTLTFDVAVPPSGVVFLYLWHTYAAYPNPNAQVLLEDYQNLYLPDVGNLLFDPALSPVTGQPLYYVELGPYFATTPGRASIGISINGLGLAGTFEGEVRVQALVVDTNVSPFRLDTTNVLRLELDR